LRTSDLDAAAVARPDYPAGLRWSFRPEAVRLNVGRLETLCSRWLNFPLDRPLRGGEDSLAFAAGATGTTRLNSGSSGRWNRRPLPDVRGFRCADHIGVSAIMD
jgi:hypothetical protein